MKISCVGVEAATVECIICDRFQFSTSYPSRKCSTRPDSSFLSSRTVRTSLVIFTRWSLLILLTTLPSRHDPQPEYIAKNVAESGFKADKVDADYADGKNGFQWADFVARPWVFPLPKG